jgi:uncharacterized protein YndB with AHSA1/START domain
MTTDSLVKPAVTFGSFTINRLLSASPERVYAAWSTAEGKARWFKAPNNEWEEVERKFDFRIGGRDRLVGKWQSGKVTDFDCIYRDIVPNARIVYVYDLVLDGRKISVSLATIEIRPEGPATRLTVTEHGAFLDGYEDAGSRERGTNAQMDVLQATLRG